MKPPDEFDEFFEKFFKKFFKEFLGEVFIIVALSFLFSLYFFFEVRLTGLGIIFLAMAVSLTIRLVKAHLK